MYRDYTIYVIMVAVMSWGAGELEGLFGWLFMVAVFWIAFIAIVFRGDK